MTIGGNDSGVFINTIVSCGAAGILSGGQGSPCKDQYGEIVREHHPEQDLPRPRRGTEGRADQRSPSAEVAILGYPWITPPTKGCFDKMPIATGDVPYVHHIQWTLNEAVRSAAAATGITYVDMNKKNRATRPARR